MSKWYEHKAYCQTESTWITDITKNESELLNCPNNNTHVLKPGSDSIINVNGGSVVRIQDQDDGVETQGFYGTEGRAFTARANTITYDAFLPGIPISILAGHFEADSEKIGDVIDAYVLPQIAQVVGACMQPVSDGDTIIHVSETVLMMAEVEKLARIELYEVATGRTSNKVRIISMNPGLGTITVETPINTEDGLLLDTSLPYGVLARLDTNIMGAMALPNTLNSTWITMYAPDEAWREFYRGRYVNLFVFNQLKTEERKIVEVDKVNMRFRIEKPFDIALTPAEGMNVYVQLSIRVSKTHELGPKTLLDVGGATLTGSYIRTDVVLCLKYNRKHETDTRVTYWYEYYY